MMEYKFKFIILPEDHGFDEEHLKFLQVLDEGLIKSREGISSQEDIAKVKEQMDLTLKEMKNTFNYDKIQKQLNDIYIRLQDRPLLRPEDMKRRERELNSKWMRCMLRKDEEGMKKVGLELKQHLEPVMHTGGGSAVLDVDMTQGGYLIPELMLAEVNRFVEEAGVARREMRYLPFSGQGNQRYIPTLLSSVTVEWIGEAEMKPKTKPLIGRVEQILRKLAAMVIFTEEIIEDAAVDLVGLSAQLIGEAIAIEEDAQFLAGVGNPWIGIINFPGIVPVSLQPGQGVFEITPENLLSLTFMIPQGAVPGAKFYMHRSVWAVLRSYRVSAVATGDREGVYAVQEPLAGTPAQIWGFPVVLTEALPGAENHPPDTPILFFGNLAKCCVYGDKQGIRVKLLDQASVYDANNTLVNLAEQDMLALRVHKRVGYVPVLPGGISVLHTGPVS